ncbi:toluene tolerance family protein [Pseudooceanicola batsensis HTCC2597]|uniref:Toluene tolerance family protein n=1 Tax=Pseudooceanicola batsensis (strain ATCC BAA-863 / DSM 15984 / KCTC 12145 / HTCC2597) TaxID=252305 RepID=A3TVR2_PSEBH|nr:ABC transporter substrate-binding protein [Pseudooceanicola batsensis]EAQ03708.1 toluene tolerance family protein [Pseudooceanicola batsensis HTCC2597]
MTTRISNELTRRALLMTGSAFALLSPAPAVALTNAAARGLVDDLVGEINRVIARGGSLPGMIRDFEKIFARYADVAIIARSTLGPDARRASPAQMRAFVEAFRGYIARKYGKRFQEFVGGRIEVQGVRQVKTWHEVISTAYLRGEAPFEVKFLVSDRSGRNLFFDMVIEGISMRLSEKTEIGAMLDANRGDIDRLIADLRRAG